MPRWLTFKTISFALAAAIITLIVYLHAKYQPIVEIGAGYKAKITCSELFVAGRNEADILTNDFTGIDPAMDLIKVTINTEIKEVFAAGPLGLGKSRAIFDGEKGCRLVNLNQAHDSTGTKPFTSSLREATSTHGSAKLERVDHDTLDAMLTDAFDTNTANHRGVLVIVDGQVIAERYANGFSKDTRFISWSMAKSITATLVGAAVHKGYLNIKDPAPVPEWADDTQKSKITWNDLLRMQSGLEFEEVYTDPGSLAVTMLNTPKDTGKLAAEQDVKAEPGELWYYSSGTTNLIARTLKQVLATLMMDWHQR